jgi:hypothetical protein
VKLKIFEAIVLLKGAAWRVPQKVLSVRLLSSQEIAKEGIIATFFSAYFGFFPLGVYWLQIVIIFSRKGGLAQ